MTRRRVIGCMTGTSLDGLDAALVEIEGVGTSMRATVSRLVSLGLGDAASSLRDLAEGRPLTARDITLAAHSLTSIHVEACVRVAAGLTVDLVCVHGQTIFHAPPLSWQLMQPAPIARALRCPVVFDLRAADLAAGGQGAPITPLSDWVLLGGGPVPTAVVNLGGFCNITLLPAASIPPDPDAQRAAIEARDVCACNQLLDAVAREALGRPYDEAGAAALRGRPDPGALAELRALVNAQSRAGRSLGSGDEATAWVSRFRSTVRPDDLAATACAAVAGEIAAHVGHAGRVVLAGGGVHNHALVGAIRAASRAPVLISDELGLPASHREAACFAVLGALCQDGVPITLPRVTGVATAPVAGAWVYPPQHD